jgi:hypothetical protein
MKCRHCGRVTLAPYAVVYETTGEPACRGACIEVSLAIGPEAHAGVQRLARRLFECGLAASAPALFATGVESQ